MRRTLSEGESGVLARIQAHCGDHNSPEDVFWFDNGDGHEEACIFVEDQHGVAVVMANLTNLAEWRVAGTLDEATL